MANINKTDIINMVKDKTGATKTAITPIVDGLIDSLKEVLTTGGKVSLNGFMTLETVDVPEKNCRNPKTGESITVPAHRKVKVKVAKNVQDLVR